MRQCAIRRVHVHDPLGRFDPQALLCTEQICDPAQVLRWFVQSWQVEVTFQEVRDHLGVETQRQRSDLAIARTTPCLLGLFSLVTLLPRQPTPGARAGPKPSGPGIASNARPIPTPSPPCAAKSGANRVSSPQPASPTRRNSDPRYATPLPTHPAMPPDGKSRTERPTEGYNNHLSLSSGIRVPPSAEQTASSYFDKSNSCRPNANPGSKGPSRTGETNGFSC